MQHFLEHRWKFLSVVFFLLIVYAISILLLPSFKDGWALFTLWRKQQVSLEQISETATELQRLQIQKKRLEQASAETGTQLPNESEWTLVLDQIQSDLRLAGLTGLGFRALARKTHLHYTLLPLEVQFKGTFLEAGRFVHALEKNQQLHLIRVQIQHLEQTQDQIKGNILLEMALKS